MGLPEKWIHSSVRVSFGTETTMEEVKEAVEIINRTVREMLGKEEDHG
jgi:cysteine sulfinate desulfinase/cysteine desulfurase-like protein